METNPIIYIVDDDKDFRSALSRLLQLSGFEVLAFEGAGQFLLQTITHRPGCILLDYHLSGPSGLEIQKALESRNISLPIIFLSGVADVSTAVLALKAGAIDFLTKPVDRKTLLHTIQNALSLQAENFRNRERLESLSDMYEALTKRERDVFQLVAAGKLNKEIASQLYICERTVKAHRANVMQKMQASSLAELIHIAILLEVNHPLLPKSNITCS